MTTQPENLPALETDEESEAYTSDGELRPTSSSNQQTTITYFLNSQDGGNVKDVLDGIVSEVRARLAGDPQFAEAWQAAASEVALGRTTGSAPARMPTPSSSGRTEEEEEDVYAAQEAFAAQDTGQQHAAYSSTYGKRKQPETTERSRKYPAGTYGDKNYERKRLRQEHDYTIDGNSTHQSEHVVGYDVAADNGTGNKGSRRQSREFENNLPAYYEEFGPHRAHEGTGNSGEIRPSGFNATSYRAAQRQALVDNEPSVAIQLNQLGYAHQPGFQDVPTDPEQQQRREIADDSYHEMISNTRASGRGIRYNPEPDAPVPAGGQQLPGTGASTGGTEHVTTRALTRLESFELHTARESARTSKWPDPDGVWGNMYPDPSSQDWRNLEENNYFLGSASQVPEEEEEQEERTKEEEEEVTGKGKEKIRDDWDSNNGAESAD